MLIVQLHLTEPSLLEFQVTAYAPDPVYASATVQTNETNVGFARTTLTVP